MGLPTWQVFSRNSKLLESQPVSQEEFAMLLIRRANLEEWIALLENERWPGDNLEGSMKNVLAAYRKMLEAVETDLQKAPRAFRPARGLADR